VLSHAFQRWAVSRSGNMGIPSISYNMAEHSTSQSPVRLGSPGEGEPM
jgi:hypothetical protein